MQLARQLGAAFCVLECWCPEDEIRRRLRARAACSGAVSDGRVDALYRAMLGRAPDQRELDWWVQAVLDRINTALPAFLASPEFQHLVPSCQDRAAVTLLVGRLYQQVLRRVASPEELA